MADWRIYYADGSSFDSTMGEPHEAPATGFICAVGYHSLGTRYIVSGKDHYLYDRDEGAWWSLDLLGIFDRLRNNVEIYAYKEGRSVGAKLFHDLMTRAHRDPDFPVTRDD